MSAEKDLFDLILVRWNVKEHWSPWNCVLLTKDEARAHVKLDNPEKAYSCQFVEKIKHRHVLAKNYFTKIPGMMDGLKTKVTTLPLPRPKERVMLLKENKTDSATPMTVTN
jgi:netrin-G3 ligand